MCCKAVRQKAWDVITWKYVRNRAGNKIIKAFKRFRMTTSFSACWVLFNWILALMGSNRFKQKYVIVKKGFVKFAARRFLWSTGSKIWQNQRELKNVALTGNLHHESAHRLVFACWKIEGNLSTQWWFEIKISLQSFCSYRLSSCWDLL